AKTPKKVQRRARRAIGSHIRRDTSLVPVRRWPLRPRNMPPMNLTKLARVSADPRTARPSHTIHSLPAIPVPEPDSMIPWYIIHFDANPLKGGTPEIDMANIRAEANVTGIAVDSPPRSPISFF